MSTAQIKLTIPLRLRDLLKYKAEQFGVPVSQFIKYLIMKEVEEAPEEPSEYLKEALARSEKDIKEGRVSPTFDNAEDAIAWLENPKATYQNGDRV